MQRNPNLFKVTATGNRSLDKQLDGYLKKTGRHGPTNKRSLSANNVSGCDIPDKYNRSRPHACIPETKRTIAGKSYQSSVFSSQI